MLSLTVASAVVAVVLLLVVLASRSAWVLLGAGHPLVGETYFPVSGYVLVLATTFGQALGWAGGTTALLYVASRAGMPVTWTIVRGAASLVYLGLTTAPLLVYHLLFGGWLLGLPREGLDAWLAANHPDARWLLLGVHPLLDLSLVPLAAVFLSTLWLTGERLRTSVAVQTVLALVLLGTSLAVSLSLAIHSALAHVRLP